MATLITSGSSDVTLPDNTTVDVTIDSGATGARRILIVQITFRNSVALTVTGITYNGDALTSFGASVENLQCSNQLWYLKAPDTGSNTLTITTNDANNSAVAVVSWMVFSDVNQTTPYDGYTSNTGIDTTAELTITSETGDTPFYTVSVRGLNPTAAAPTNYTERYENFNGNGIFATGGEGTGAASVAFVGTITATAMTSWVTLGANLNTDTGAGGSAVKTSNELAFASTKTYNELAIASRKTSNELA